MHHFMRQFRGLPILRKKYHLMPFAPRLFENFDASAPGSFLAVVDFPQVEHLPLHDTLRGTPSVLHDAPVALCHPSREACSAKTCRHCRSEEHTSELQSRSDLVCRLLLEK